MQRESKTTKIFKYLLFLKAAYDQNMVSRLLMVTMLDAVIITMLITMFVYI